MTFVLGALHLSDTTGSRDSGPITLGALALILVAIGVVGITYRRAMRARLGLPGRRHPRRGTSALLLAAIASVVLGLASTAQRPLASLTIVSREANRPTLTMTRVPASTAVAVGHMQGRTPAR